MAFISKTGSCPHCRSKDTERRRRPLLVKYSLFFLNTRYHLCLNCRKTFIELR